jgi:hypothetical protein
MFAPVSFTNNQLRSNTSPGERASPTRVCTEHQNSNEQAFHATRTHRSAIFN